MEKTFMQYIGGLENAIGELEKRKKGLVGKSFPDNWYKNRGTLKKFKEFRDELIHDHFKMNRIIDRAFKNYSRNPVQFKLLREMRTIQGKLAGVKMSLKVYNIQKYGFIKDNTHTMVKKSGRKSINQLSGEALSGKLEYISGLCAELIKKHNELIEAGIELVKM